MWEFLKTRLNGSDYNLVWRLTNGRLCDLAIRPSGRSTYLLRWYMIPRSDQGNYYLHVQLRDDQDRAPHDHPWDNTSFLLRGGYRELLYPNGLEAPVPLIVKPGDVRHRRAETLHRLELLGKYSISLFWTGAKTRTWGFQLPSGWVSFEDATETTDGVSRWKPNI